MPPSLGLRWRSTRQSRAMFYSVVVTLCLSSKVLVDAQCKKPLPDIRRVKETDPPGTLLYNLDMDDRTSWRYKLSVKTKAAADIFNTYLNTSEDNNFYNLTVAKTLDLEEITKVIPTFKGYMSVIFFCKDLVFPEMKYTILLVVSGVGEYAPEFVPPEIELSIPEGTKKGTLLAKLLDWATDRDVSFLNREIRSFSMTPVHLYNKTVIRMEQNYDGVIALAEEVDFEEMENATLFFHIQVKDIHGFIGNGTLIVTIVDIDDQPPLFYYDGCPNPCAVVYRVELDLNFTGVVDKIHPALIKARDGDALDYNITYSIVAGPPRIHVYLELDEHNADLRVKERMFGYLTHEILIRIKAQEVSKQKRSTESYLFIKPLVEREKGSKKADQFDLFNGFTILLVIAVACSTFLFLANLVVSSFIRKKDKTRKYNISTPEDVQLKNGRPKPKPRIDTEIDSEMISTLRKNGGQPSSRTGSRLASRRESNTSFQSTNLESYTSAT